MRSVRRASDFVLTGYPEVNPEPPEKSPFDQVHVASTASEPNLPNVWSAV
jgi:hypothetical protein